MAVYSLIPRVPDKNPRPDAPVGFSAPVSHPWNTAEASRPKMTLTRLNAWSVLAAGVRVLHGFR